MEKQDPTLLLLERIQQKEAERAAEGILLKAQFKTTMESLKTINLIKEAFTSSVSKNGVMDTALGMTSGYLIKKAIVRNSSNPLLKLLGALAGTGAANLAAKSPVIKIISQSILNAIFKKEEEPLEKEK